MAEAGVVREWRAPFHVEVRLTLSVHGRARSDPTFRVDGAGAVWRTSLTPEGPGTIRVVATTPKSLQADTGAPAGTRVLARAWGPGAAWLLDAVPAALGLYDDISGFDLSAPGTHPVLREVVRRHPGLRLGRSGRLMEALVPAILIGPARLDQHWHHADANQPHAEPRQATKAARPERRPAVAQHEPRHAERVKGMRQSTAHVDALPPPGT